MEKKKNEKNKNIENKNPITLWRMYCRNEALHRPLLTELCLNHLEFPTKVGYQTGSAQIKFENSPMGFQKRLEHHPVTTALNPTRNAVFPIVPDENETKTP